MMAIHPTTGSRPILRSHRTTDRRDLLLLVAVIAIAAVLRLWQLGEPGRLVFDEAFYAQDACTYLGWGAARCGVAVEASWMHPPMGKWLIAAGIALLGNEPAGWRLTAALAGTVAVGLLFVLARRLTGSLAAAAVAALVLALDPLSIVSSRVAMLDNFVATALVGLVLFAVLDRDALGAPVSHGSPPRRWWRPWRIATGVAAGVAVATKWSAAPVVLAVVMLVLAWEAGASRRAGRGAWRGASAAVPSVVLWLGVLPALIYGAAYAGRLDADLVAPPWAAGSWVREVLYRQLEMFRFHAGLEGTHPYASPAWSWLLGKRAVLYFFELDPAGRYREVLAIPNVLLWIPGAAAAVAAGIVAVRRHTPWGAAPVVAAVAAAAYLPWLVLAGRPFVFLYYVVPAVPFLALALGWAVAALPRRAGRRLGAALGAVALAAFLFWAPLLYAWPLTYEEWRVRIVFGDCTPLEQTDGRLAPRPGGGEPPPGWCWA